MENQYLMKALDLIEDGLLLINREMGVEFANEQAKKLLRKTALVGTKEIEAVWDGLISQEKSPALIAFETGQKSEREKNFDDGTCLHIHAYPVDSECVVETIWNVTDYVSLEKRLEEASGNDAVTGLRSGNLFSKDIEKELERAKTTKSVLSMVIFEFGVDEGRPPEIYEEILRSVTKVLNDAARIYDTVYRLSGSTFVVLMPHCEIDNAKSVAERLLIKLRETVGELDFSVGISSSKTAFTGRDIIRLAERALYVAKYRGTNNIVLG